MFPIQWQDNKGAIGNAKSQSPNLPGILKTVPRYI
jgi:hypothetical protein